MFKNDRSPWFVLSTIPLFKLVLATCLFCSICFAQQAPEGKELPIVTDGVRAFYETAESLRADEDPTAETWKELLEAPGYAQITAKEDRAAWVEEWFSLAYRPSLAPERERRMAADNMSAKIVLPNLAFAIEQRPAIEAMIAELSREGTHDDILEYVAAWLPEGTVENVEAPKLYLIVLDGDSKALPTGIVLDVVGLAMTGIDYSKRLFAHEFHHHYRQSLDVLELDDVPLDIRPVVRLMERAETEGIADLIDKRDLVLDPSGLPPSQLAHPLFRWMWDQYLPLFRAAPDHVTELNLLLEQIHAEQLDLDRAKALERAAARIGARPLGVFISDAIERKLGRERVVSSVGDPFAWMLAYAEAARDDSDLPSLSEKACEALRQLKATYGSRP